MRFAPQRCAIFEHQNVQNWSEPAVFCTFWLTNVLGATAVCHFWTSELQKLVPQWGLLDSLTWKCASRHSAVPFFICLLNSYLRTPALSRLLFEHQEPRIIEKPQRFATSLTFAARVFVDLLSSDSTRVLIFFLLTWHLYSAFQLSILSEIRLLNFLRIYINIICIYLFVGSFYLFCLMKNGFFFL